MRKVGVKRQRLAGEDSCRVTIASSRKGHHNVALDVFAARPLNKGDIIGPLYEMIVYWDPSSRQSTRTLYQGGVFKTAVAQTFEYALQLRARGRRSDRITKLLGNGKKVCCPQASSCV